MEAKSKGSYPSLQAQTGTQAVGLQNLPFTALDSGIKITLNANNGQSRDLGSSVQCPPREKPPVPPAQ